MAAALPPGTLQDAIVRHLLAAGADPALRNLENEQPIHLLRPGPGSEGVSITQAEWPLSQRGKGEPPHPTLTLEGDLSSYSPLISKRDL